VVVAAVVFAVSYMGMKKAGKIRPQVSIASIRDVRQYSFLVPNKVTQYKKNKQRNKNGQK